MHPTLLQAFDTTKPNTIALPLKMVTSDQVKKNPTDYSFTQILKFQQQCSHHMSWPDFSKDNTDTTAAATGTSEEFRD